MIIAIKTLRKKKGAITIYTTKKAAISLSSLWLGPRSTPALDTAESKILKAGEKKNNSKNYIDGMT